MPDACSCGLPHRMQQIRTPWTDIAHIKNAVEKVWPGGSHAPSGQLTETCTGCPFWARLIPQVLRG